MYLKLSDCDYSDNPIAMPPEYILAQGKAVVFQYLARLWRAQSSKGVDAIGFKIKAIEPEVLELRYLEQVRSNCILGCLQPQLYLAKNEIREIPPGIGLLTELKELNLASNLLSGRPPLPHSVALTHRRPSSGTLQAAQSGGAAA